jgi:thioredoxin reductase/CRP-like cAMP-binding protein/Fe-S-cluster-containing hydrogenase component 2
MTEHYQVAIIGSGPGGLSAGARAAERQLSHVVIEKSDHIADTIQKYQKGKLVMATPDVLPLRSDVPFERGARELVLGKWIGRAEALNINLRLRTSVEKIEKESERFRLGLADGVGVTADHIVLAMGTQGNIRKLAVPGVENVSHVQYQLDDPDAHQDESIVVIGAGDAAIENAVALASHNRVTIVNRRDEFARAKDGNLSLILESIERGLLSCLYNARPTRVDEGSIILSTPDGETVIECDRVIARLGSTPPRAFLESCGITFVSDDPSALPNLNTSYESNVPGLYIIGALGGYPLIKQAMNQGYEVIEFILGNEIAPADEPLLAERLEPLGLPSVNDGLAAIQASLPIFSDLPQLVFRELMMESRLVKREKGEIVFRKNGYTNSFFGVLRGEVLIDLEMASDGERISRKAGDFFGEMGLISGRRRSATARSADSTVLIEVPRRSMVRVLSSFASVKTQLDKAAIARFVDTYISPDLSPEDVQDIAESAEIGFFKQNEVIIRQGDAADCIHLIRSGSVIVSRTIAGREIILSYVPAGQYVGEAGVLLSMPRSATVRAAVACETIKIDGDVFKGIFERRPGLRVRIDAELRKRSIENSRMEDSVASGNIIQFLVEQGLGEATDVLLIDDSLCTRCNNCEIACAETHGGISRLDREAGPTFENVHVPTSCRHCEHPHCMADCPPDAIHRAASGEVYIDDSCIGCGNCVRNCPYDVIQMAGLTAKPRGLLGWLGAGARQADDEKVAVKCDMCMDIEGGAACVRACPTGAAIRVHPEEFMSIAMLARRENI